MKHVALLGCGIVGGGVARIFEERGATLERAVGEPVRLKYVLEKRSCAGEPWADRVTQDFGRIERDPEVSVVCECMGGVGAAYEFARRSLLAGKSVVTSNKQLIAEHGLELLTIAKEKGVLLLFEASVGGGIPLLRPLADSLAADRIEEVFGIVNGTTNYILTQMLDHGATFDAALAEAQAMGYAEADPSADVDGLDAMRKVCILASLAFGSSVSPAAVPTEGIRGVTARDAAFAGRLGYAIKLIAHARRLPDDRITAFVSPRLVPKGTLLADVGGVMNAAVIRGEDVGECLFYGAGAGRMPTASAVVGDAVDALRRGGRGYYDWGPERPERFVHPDELPFKWYVRYRNGCAEGPTERRVSEGGESAGVTPPMTRAELEAAFRSLDVLSLFRVLE